MEIKKVYSKDKIRVGFALSEYDIEKLKKYMSANNLSSFGKAFKHLLDCASVDVVTVPKTNFGYILELLRTAKIALKDVLTDLEKK